jgi:hypothetical protein
VHVNRLAAGGLDEELALRACGPLAEPTVTVRFGMLTAWLGVRA